MVTSTPATETSRPTSLVVPLNPQLEEQAPYQVETQEHLIQRIASVLKPLSHPVDPKERWNIRYHSPVNRSYFPEGAATHTAFMYALSNAYSLHQSISFGPHDLWYVIMTEIARTINANPKQFETLFTRTPGEKQSIIVEGFDNLDLKAVCAQLRDLVPVNIDVFMPDFSTHTFESKMATMAAFADAVKSYYNYMTLACGIKSLEIRGSVQDWELFYTHLGELSLIFGSTFREWFGGIGLRIENIIEALSGGSTEFFQTIFRSTRVGSGGELNVDGWFAREFFLGEGDEWKYGRKLENFPNTWSVVPFKNIETGREFSMVHGCFYSEIERGFRVPGYGYLTFEMPPSAA